MAVSDSNKLQSILALSSEMMCILDADGRFVHANPSWERELGLRATELHGRRLRDMLHSDDRAALDRALAPNDTGTSGGTVMLEARFQLGEHRHRLLTFTLWVDPETGELFAAARGAEQAKRDADLAFRAEVMGAAPLYITALRPDGTLALINENMLRACGYIEEEVLGKPYAQLFVPEREHKLLEPTIDQLIDEHGQTLMENHVLTKDGRELLVEWHGRTLLAPDGSIDMIVGIGVDITLRRTMEEALRRTERKLAQYAKQTPLAMIECDRDLRITSWNPGAAAFFKYSEAEALGKRLPDLIVSPDARATVTAELSNLTVQEGSARGVQENITRDGELLFCEWHTTALVDESGTLAGLLSIVSDVSEQRRLEDELRQRERAQAVMIQRLSTPILDLWNGVLTLPIIGAIDETRTARMTESLLQAIVHTRARFTIVDVTGLEGMDASSAGHLIQMMKATGLLGSQCLLSGISPEMARVLVELGVDMGDLQTFSSLKSALGFALSKTPDNGRAGARLKA